MTQQGTTPEQHTVDQEARLAYEAYRAELGTSFPLAWEDLPALMQHAWRGVALAMRLYNTEGQP